jgi:3-deoxy-D-manno-octulosonic-acid transferase
MRAVYALLTYLLMPLYAMYWVIRGIVNRRYWDRFDQRLGFGFPRLPNGSLWVHAVSVGEVQASVPLVRQLQRRFPGREIVLTTVTPTGSAHARKVFGDEVHYSYIPFEAPYAVDNFFDAVNPTLALVMETEIWPNLYHACGQRKIPLVLVSARISPKSVSRYRKLLPLFREALSHGILIAAQGDADARRFLSLGASPARTWITGNIKFDFELPRNLAADGRALRQRCFPDRPVWIAASTHEGEEEMALEAHRRVLESIPDALLMLVPRHPERFQSVATLLRKAGFEFVQRTSGEACSERASIFLGDTMGELPLFYAASDVAFVGGSLVPVGGHNLLEPGALGLPVITGPHLYNTEEIAKLFRDIGASKIVSDPRELADAVVPLLSNPDTAKAMGRKGRQVVTTNRGALKRLMVLLKPLVSDGREAGRSAR